MTIEKEHLFILETIVVLWALIDSIKRRVIYKANQLRPNGCIRKSHSYVPIHYVFTFVGLIICFFEIGKIELDSGFFFSFKLLGFLFTIVGWLITYQGRKNLGINWSPDVYIINYSYKTSLKD